MKTVETKLPVGRILKIEAMPDGSYKVVQEVVISREDFVLIEAESLSENDSFLNHKPKTEREAKTRRLILEAIEKKVKNFERPRCDPAYCNDAHTDICFVPGGRPAVDRSYNWWKDIAQQHNLRLGTRLQYAAFLGVLIKKLIEEGKSVEWAWNAVCNDSKALGHYSDSADAKYEFELTGSRSICGLCDLANTFKILAEDEEAGGFWLASGNYNNDGNYYPLADLDHNIVRDGYIGYGVGWLVR